MRVQAVEFMTLASPHRWGEVQGWFPPRWENETHPVEQVDNSWIDLRTLQNLSPQGYSAMYRVRGEEDMYQSGLRFARRFSVLRNCGALHSEMIRLPKSAKVLGTCAPINSGRDLEEELVFKLRPAESFMEQCLRLKDETFDYFAKRKMGQTRDAVLKETLKRIRTERAKPKARLAVRWRVLGARWHEAGINSKRDVWGDYPLCTRENPMPPGAQGRWAHKDARGRCWWCGTDL